MFRPIHKGTSTVLYGAYKCWIPPAPDKSQILFYGRPRQEQFWSRLPLPANFDERYAEEQQQRRIEEELVLGKQKDRVTHVDPVLERFRRQEFYRRRWGVWFYNDGQPTYITGHHYWYLQWCRYDNGYPNYYEYSRDTFYFRQYCEEDQLVLGYIIFASRGTGKSNEELACITNNILVSHDARAALQSKSLENDSKKVLFKAKLVPLFTSLPKFFQPIFSHSTDPSGTMIFRMPPVKGKQASAISIGEESQLNSFIMAVQPGEKVLDTETLQEILVDEIGKCFVYGTKILMFNGTIKEVQDVIPGDILMGNDSTPRTVLSTTRGSEMCYDIVPNKGDRWGCNKSHILSLKWCWQRPLKIKGKTYHKNQVVNISLEDYFTIPPSVRKHFMQYRVGVEYPEKRHVIDPYILGVWIGDGRSNCFAFFTADNEIKESVLSFFDANGYDGRIVTGNQAGTVLRISGRTNGSQDIKLTRELLSTLELKNNKHIPHLYLIDSRKNRLSLLAGILDTDGSLNSIGNRVNYEVTQKSEKVARDIHRLANSLGFYCSIYAKMATMKRKDGTVFTCKVFRLNIFGHNLHEIPCRVSRKICHQRTVFHKNTRQPQHTGINIVPRGVEEYYGFTIDGNKLFLLSDYTVVHNTERAVANVYERHKTNMKSVFRNHRKVGMERNTSTVELMGESTDLVEKIWKESDPHVRDKNGQTVSRILRYFVSSLTTDTSPEACDRHGRANREVANQKIENALEPLKHDYFSQASEMRKNPRNEAELFIRDQSRTVFNVQKMTARLNHLRHELSKPPYRRGNLYPVRDKFGPVWFADDESTGRFKFAWFPDEFVNVADPDKCKILNNVTREWGYDVFGNSRELIMPKNDHLFRLGTDPIKFTRTKDPRRSKAAIHAFRLYDHNVDYGIPKEKWKSHNFFVEYIERPENPMTYLEDLANLCIFLGCRVLPERNIPDVNSFFENNGLERMLAYPKDFVQYRREYHRKEQEGEKKTEEEEPAVKSAGVLEAQSQSEDAGYASTPEVIDYYTKRLITFINEHCHRMPFDDTIEDWMKFDPAKPTTSHATVSSGFTLVHAEKISELEEEPQENIAEWFDIYDNSGQLARPISQEEYENLRTI